MSRKSLYGIGVIIVSTLGIIIALGQGCAGGSSLPGFNGFGGSTGPNLSIQVPNPGQILGIGGLHGNGGGYGGMVSTTEQYGEGGARGHESSTEHQQSAQQAEHHGRNSSFSSLGDDFRAAYFHVGDRTANCTRLPDEWKPLDAHISGVLSLQHHRAYYGGSLCGRTSMLRSSVVSIVDFNSQIAVFANKVFERFEDHPPTLNDLKTTVAYCRSAIFAQPESGADLGADVRIYRNSVGLFGEIIIGKDVGGTLTRSVVRGFAVSGGAEGEGALFTPEGFELRLTNMDANPTTGSLSVLLDGEQREVPLTKCWH